MIKCGMRRAEDKMAGSCEVEMGLKSAGKKDFVYQWLSVYFNGKLRNLTVILGAILLTACSKEVEKSSLPLEIEEKTECALDGMLLSEYSGPKAQIHYRGNKVPDFFCETEELFKVYLQPGIKAEVTAIYVQDTAAVDWDKPVDSWIDARTAFFVVESRRQGAMGQTYASFKSREAAASFINEYGGELMTFAQVADKVEKGTGM